MFTLKQLALPGIEKLPNEVNSPSAKPSTLMKVLFLKGPIPLPWLMTTACLPGKTLEVGIALWFLSGVKKNYEVVLSNKLLSEFGVNRYAKHRALRAMEEASLISVFQKHGRSPVITILVPGG
jgi:hypothetical protein